LVGGRPGAAPAGAHGWRHAWTLRSSTASGLRCPQGAANPIFVLATISDASSRWALPRRRTNAKPSAPWALAQLQHQEERVPPTLPGRRCGSAARRASRERDQLLCHLPDRPTALGEPLPLALAQGHPPEANGGFGIGRASSRYAVATALFRSNPALPA